MRAWPSHGWLALAFVPLAWGVLFAPVAQDLEQHLPWSDVALDHALGVAVSIVFGLVLWLLPIPLGDRKLLAILWQAKVFVTIGLMLFYERHYDSLDSFTYYRWSLDPAVGWPEIQLGEGTFNLVFMLKALDLILPSSYQLFKVVFSAAGLLGVYGFYRAAQGLGVARSPASLVGITLFPSVLFWSSILGKDPLALLGLGAASWGLVRRGPVGFAVAATFVVALLLVRPWLSGMVLAATLVVLVRRGLRGHPWPVRTLVWLALAGAVVAAAMATAWLAGLTSWTAFLAEFNEVTQVWGYGGSAQRHDEFRSLRDILVFFPLGAFTALFRPLPWELTGPFPFGLVVVLEGAVLLTWTGLAIGRATPERLRPDWVVWTLAYLVGWLALYSFISYQNLGTAVRFRLGILPFFLMLLAWFARSGASVSRPVQGLRRAADLTLACMAAGALLVAIALRLAVPSRARRRGRRLLVLDTSYDLATARARGLESPILARDLDGYFDHVWTVHPLVGADQPGRTGGIQQTSLAPRHDVLESPIRRVPELHGLPRLDFVIAQADLLWRLDRLVRTQGLAAIRVGDPYYQGLVGWALSRANRLPLVVRIGGNYDEIFSLTGRQAYPRLFLSRRVEKKAERFVLRRAALVAGANSNNLAWAVRNGADPARTAVFRYGNLVHPAHFIEPALRPPPDPADLPLTTRRFVVFVGRLEPAKHAEDLVQVARLLVPRVHDVSFVVVGDGTLRPQMQAAARAAGVSDRLMFVGARGQDWLARVVPHASAIASPHMGRALVECALAGVPIVAYDLDWHAELVEDGLTGALVPPRRPDLMAEALERILQDPAEGRRLGQAARRRALAMMDPDALAATERAAYARLLGP
jgi:glycosyltransferase involved in cell wall biosynthesis